MRTGPTHTFAFFIGASVRVDQSDVSGTVTAMMLEDREAESYKIEWVNNGTNNVAWIQQFRLTYWE